MIALSGQGAGSYSWSMVLERIDRPTEHEWVRGEGDTPEIDLKGKRLKIAVTTGISVSGDGVRTATATVDNRSAEFRVRRFYARPFVRAVPETFEAIYYPSGLGLRYARLPGRDSGHEAFGWIGSKRADGETRYGLKVEGIISPGVYPCWTTTMAWLTCTWKGGGVYWGCHDPAYSTKWPLPLYDAKRRELTFEAAYEIMLDSGKTWSMPPTVERVYSGDWHRAADFYRSWLLSTTVPLQTAPKGMTGQLLCILKQQNETIMWPYTEFAALAETAKAHGLDWIGLFGWTKGGHDHLYPDYEPDPDMGGREALVRGIRQIHEKGLKCYLYANGQLQEREATEFWRSIGRHNAIVNEMGETYRETWHKFADAPAHTFDLGCLRSKAWFERMLSLARQANELGADGILYDQLGNSPPRPCYAKNHGHPVGQMVFAEDKELFLRRIKHEMAKVNPKFIFMTEGLGDMFVDTFSFYHGMSAGAHPYMCMDNVKRRLAGGVNEGADFWPEIFRYALPEVVSTCRMPSPFLTRNCVNYDAFFGLKHEIEIRFRPDRRYVETGVHPGEAAYDKILGPPMMDLMAGFDQRTAQRYLKAVCAFQRKWAKYLLDGTFRDTDKTPVSGLPMKRFEAADGTSAFLAWNVADRPLVPKFADSHCMVAAESPEEGAVDPSSPIPPNSLRLFIDGKPLVADAPKLTMREWTPPVKPGATHYVDAIAGDDARDGLTPATAWRTLAKAKALTLGPGERLLLRRDSVFCEELTLRATGAKDNWAEIGAYGEGARPIISRTRHINERCVFLKDVRFLAIRDIVVCNAGNGLAVFNSPKAGPVLIERCLAHHIEGVYRFNSHGIPEWRDCKGAPGGDGVRSAGFDLGGGAARRFIFRDCEVYQCSSGFRISGSDSFVNRIFCHDNYVPNTSPHPYNTTSKSWMTDCVFDASGWQASAGTMGIMLYANKNLVIRNCHFLNQPDSGSPDMGGIDFEAKEENCLVDHCTFRNNAGAAIEILGLRNPQARNVHIRGCRFYCNNYARRNGPAEVSVWGSPKAGKDVLCSSGTIENNGYVLLPGIPFYRNDAPMTTNAWRLSGNRQFATAEELDKAFPYVDPPNVCLGDEVWTDEPTVHLSAIGQASCQYDWEVREGLPGVRFANPKAAETTASFPSVGDYRLAIRADNGTFWRTARTAVHVLPKATKTVRAWTFARNLDNEGWTAESLGTQFEYIHGKEPFWDTHAHPVKLVCGDYYVVAMKDSGEACLTTPDDRFVGVSFVPDRCNAMRIRCQNHTNSKRMRLYWQTIRKPVWSKEQSIAFDVKPNDTQDTVYTVALPRVGWVKRLKLAFSADGEPVTGTCRIDYIWFGRIP